MQETRRLYFLSILLQCVYFTHCDSFIQSGRYYQHLEIKNLGKETLNVFLDSNFVIALSPKARITGDVIVVPPRLEIIIPDKDESELGPVNFHYWGPTVDSNSSKPHVFRFVGKIRDSVIYCREFTVTTRNFDSLKFMNQIDIK